MPAEDMVFSRKASGLTRGLSFWDSFGVGFMNQGLTPSIWVVTSLGLGVYVGGNLIIATIMSVVLAGIGMPLVWGILGGSMPRSGGEYIYNSRILSPAIGIAESFVNAFVWIMWIYVQAPWIADPGMKMIADFLGWEALADFCTNLWGVYLIATITNILCFSCVVFGLKLFARIQKVVMTLGIAGTTAICIVLSMYSQKDFIASWDRLAAQYDSLPYNGFMAGVAEAAGSAMPTTWNWYDTFGLMTASAWLFAYAYCITFIAGEVKRPDKVILSSNLAAILVPGFFMLWTAIALYHMVPFEFLSSAMWLDNNGTELIADYSAGGATGYNLPWSPHYVGLMAVVNQNPMLLFFAGLSFILFDFWFIVLAYLAFPRIIFAWGMDRMGPKWFTSISPRFASPVKNHLLCLALGQASITLYVFWVNNPMQGVAVTCVEVLSVWSVTAIAALLFPYRKRAQGIWEASPYRTWKILGIPVVSLGAGVDLVYLGIIAYFFFLAPVRTEDFGLFTGILIVSMYAFGVAWYYFWKSRSKRVGLDVGLAFGQLPPE